MTAFSHNSLVRVHGTGTEDADISWVAQQQVVGGHQEKGISKILILCSRPTSTHCKSAAQHQRVADLMHDPACAEWLLVCEVSSSTCQATQAIKSPILDSLDQ